MGSGLHLSFLEEGGFCRDESGVEGSRSLSISPHFSHDGRDGGGADAAEACPDLPAGRVGQLTAELDRRRPFSVPVAAAPAERVVGHVEDFGGGDVE